MSNNAIRHKNTSGPAEPISSKVSRSQNLTVLSAEPVQGIKKKTRKIYTKKKSFKSDVWVSRIIYKYF